jgi:hypothetical protein
VCGPQRLAIFSWTLHLDEHYHLCESEIQQGNVEMIIVAPINKLSISEVDTSDI